MLGRAEPDKAKRQEIYAEMQQIRGRKDRSSYQGRMVIGLGRPETPLEAHLELPDVKRISAENAEGIKNPPPRPFPWALVAAVLAVVSVGGASGFAWLRWKRNRFRIRASEVARLVDASPDPPLILDVRDASTYDKSPVRIPNARHFAPEALEGGSPALAIEPTRTVVAYCT